MHGEKSGRSQERMVLLPVGAAKEGCLHEFVVWVTFCVLFVGAVVVPLWGGRPPRDLLSCFFSAFCQHVLRLVHWRPGALSKFPADWGELPPEVTTMLPERGNCAWFRQCTQIALVCDVLQNFRTVGLHF